MKYYDDFDGWIVPDGSHGEELASLVILSPGHQEGAFADMPVISCEDFLSPVFFLTVVFIFSIQALEDVVTAELLWHADLLSSPLASISSSATQLLTTAFTLLLLDFVAAILADVACSLALARCVTCASVPACLVTAFPLPKGLVGAHLRVDCLPSGSFAGKLDAGVGEPLIAPRIQWEAVVARKCKS